MGPMASKRVLRTWAGCVAAALAAVVAVGGADAGAAAAPVCSDAAYLTWREADGGRHTLSIIDFDSGDREDVATLDFHVNAIGHSTADRRLYGLARSSGSVVFASAPHLVSIDARGGVRDWGPLRTDGVDASGLGGSYAGTVYEDKLRVLSGTRLTSIDIAADRGRITGQVTLDEPLVSLNIGDITAAPGSDELHGVSTRDQAVVSIDPDSGGVTRTPVTGIPARSLAGAIFAGPDRRLHAVVNGVDGEAVMYRVAVPGKGSGPLRAVEEARWPKLASADAAFCSAPPVKPQDPPGPAGPSPTAAAANPSPAVTPGRESPPPVARPDRSRPPGDGARPSGSRTAARESESEAPRRWIAVGAVVIGMVGAAGVKAGAKRTSK